MASPGARQDLAAADPRAQVELGPHRLRLRAGDADGEGGAAHVDPRRRQAGEGGARVRAVTPGEREQEQGEEAGEKTAEGHSAFMPRQG